MKNGRYLKSVLINGIILGFMFCLYTTLMWVSKLDTTYLRIGQYLDMAVILLPIVVIILAIVKLHKQQRISLAARFIVAIGISAVSYLIYDPFLYAYHEYINQEWFDSVLQLKETELKALGKTQSEIATTLEKMKANNKLQSGIYRMATLIPSVVVIPVLIGLISFLFTRKKRVGE